MMTISGNSVNIRNDCLDNLDKPEYNSLPMFIIVTKSLGEVIEFLLLYMRAHNDIATHWRPAYEPNNATLPWL